MRKSVQSRRQERACRNEAGTILGGRRQDREDRQDRQIDGQKDIQIYRTDSTAFVYKRRGIEATRGYKRVRRGKIGVEGEEEQSRGKQSRKEEERREQKRGEISAKGRGKLKKKKKKKKREQEIGGNGDSKKGVRRSKKKSLQHRSFAYGLPLHYSVRLLVA